MRRKIAYVLAIAGVVITLAAFCWYIWTDPDRVVEERVGITALMVTIGGLILALPDPKGTDGG